MQRKTWIKTCWKHREFPLFSFRKSFSNLKTIYHILANTNANVNLKTNYFGNLEISITKYKGKGNIFIMGNLNARIGKKGNIHSSKLNEDLRHILPNNDDSSKLTKRHSNNLKTNTSSNTLMKLCNHCNLKIANGQSPGDRIRHFAWFNNSGASVVDYVLAETSIYENIIQFKVLPPEYDSKHAPIIIIVKAGRLEI